MLLLGRSVAGPGLLRGCYLSVGGLISAVYGAGGAKGSASLRPPSEVREAGLPAGAAHEAAAGHTLWLPSTPSAGTFRLSGNR